MAAHASLKGPENSHRNRGPCTCRGNHTCGGFPCHCPCWGSKNVVSYLEAHSQDRAAPEPNTCRNHKRSRTDASTPSHPIFNPYTFTATRGSCRKCRACVLKFGTLTRIWRNGSISSFLPRSRPRRAALPRSHASRCQYR